MRPPPATTIIFVTLTLVISCCCQIIPFQEDITRDANDDVSMDESIRSKEGPVEERSRPRRRLNQLTVYKERTSVNCGDSGGGEGENTSAAACEAGTVTLGWSDYTAGTNTGIGSWSKIPSECSLLSRVGAPNPFFNSNNNNSPIDCNGCKCICTLVCQSGFCQDEAGPCAGGTKMGQSLFKPCETVANEAGVDVSSITMTSTPMVEAVPSLLNELSSSDTDTITDNGGHHCKIFGISCL